MFAKAKAYYKEHFIKNLISSVGRISRKEMQERGFLLTLTFVGLYIVIVALLSLTTFLFGKDTNNGTYALAWIMAAIAIVIPVLTMWSILVRRLHDLGYSGWYILLGFLVLLLGIIGSLGILIIPLASTFIFFYIELMPSIAEKNKYGVPPVINENDWLDNEENRTFRRFKQYLFSGEWKNDYLTFKGRLTCREFFFLAYGFLAFQSILTIISTFIMFVSVLLNGFERIEWLEVLLGLVNLIYIIFLYPVNVRRNHDFGNSWIWTLLILIPGVNIWYLLRQFCFTGDLEENKYGKPRTWVDENGVLRNNEY